MANFVIVTGSPGAGKTTIVSGAKFNGCKVINIGTLMLEEAKRLGYTDDRDKIRYMNGVQLDRTRTRAFSKLASFKGNIVVDTHNFVEEHGRFIPGLPEKLLSKLHTIKAFIYVDAPELEILERRKKDRGRHREVEDEEIIKSQRTLNLSVLSYYSSKLNVPVYIIENKNGELKASIKRYRAIIKEVFA